MITAAAKIPHTQANKELHPVVYPTCFMSQRILLILPECASLGTRFAMEWWPILNIRCPGSQRKAIQNASFAKNVELYQIHAKDVERLTQQHVPNTCQQSTKHMEMVRLMSNKSTSDGANVVWETIFLITTLSILRSSRGH